MKLDVLAIGAHPDDVELSCGGTLAKLVKNGRVVGIVDLTQGELGTRGSAEIRAREAAEAARILGVSVRENLQIPDGNIENSMANRHKLIQAIRNFRPEVILFPFSSDRHPDHEGAHVLCKEAWFQSGLEKVPTEYKGKRQAAFRPRTFYNFMQWFEFAPSFVVDVTEEYDQSMQAIKAFKSQFHDPSSDEPDTVLSSPEFMEMLRVRREYYGDRIGCRYGEPFYSVNLVGIADILSIRP